MALMKGTQAQRNQFGHMLGMAIHEAEAKIKNAAREAANKQRAAIKAADGDGA